MLFLKNSWRKRLIRRGSDSSKWEKSSLNRTAAEIAALSFYELFPGLGLLGGKETSLGFSFDFLCDVLVPAQAEILVEEKMRQIVREKRPIRLLEMVPFSARELLLKEGHRARAEEVGEGGLVEVIQIGNFHNLSQGPHLTCSSHLSAFKLWPIQELEKGVLRLSGCAFPSKAELKQFLKLLRNYPEKSHERVGVREALWCFAGSRVVWLTNGLRLQKDVVEIIREHLFRGIFEVRLSFDGDRAIHHALLARERGVEGIGEIYLEPMPPWDSEVGLFLGVGGQRVRLSFYGPPNKWREKVISSLQLAEKTLNVLGFQYQLHLSGRDGSGRGLRAVIELLEQQGTEIEICQEEQGFPRLDYMVKDHLERRWAAFSIELTSKAVCITASVERLVALFLEQKSRTNKR
jgi:threonyl-tRNA synthetase